MVNTLAVLVQAEVPNDTAETARVYFGMTGTGQWSETAKRQNSYEWDTFGYILVNREIPLDPFLPGIAGRYCCCFGFESGRYFPV